MFRTNSLNAIVSVCCFSANRDVLKKRKCTVTMVSSFDKKGSLRKNVKESKYVRGKATRGECGVETMHENDHERLLYDEMFSVHT